MIEEEEDAVRAAGELGLVEEMVPTQPLTPAEQEAKRLQIAGDNDDGGSGNNNSNNNNNGPDAAAGVGGADADATVALAAAGGAAASTALTMNEAENARRNADCVKVAPEEEVVLNLGHTPELSKMRQDKMVFGEFPQVGTA